MQLTNILSLGLLSLSAVSAAPNPTTPDDSQITLPPNFDYRHDYGELQDDLTWPSQSQPEGQLEVALDRRLTPNSFRRLITIALSTKATSTGCSM